MVSNDKGRWILRTRVSITLIGIALFWSGQSTQAAGTPEDEIAGIIQAFLAKDFSTEWRGVDSLPRIAWADLPATGLQNCLPDGNCYVRQGTVVVGERNIAATAAGARTFTTSLYLRNAAKPFGEASILTALREASFSAELARCPAAGTAGSSHWYRLRSPKTNPGVLSIQTSCNGTACESFVVSHGEALPPLQASEVRLYSEECGAGSDRKPVSTVLPYERLAQALVSFIPPVTASSPYTWKTFTALKNGITWPSRGATRLNLSYMDDPNPYSMSADVTYAGRHFSAIVSGSQSQPMTLHLIETGLHARGEDVLGALRVQGFTVQLARCGLIYTESTHNWYRVTSTRTRPVVLKQSIRREGNQAQDSYSLRLDGTMPVRDPRDRDPGFGGCQ
jgi:hypothetical protein